MSQNLIKLYYSILSKVTKHINNSIPQYLDCGAMVTKDMLYNDKVIKIKVYNNNTALNVPILQNDGILSSDGDIYVDSRYEKEHITFVIPILKNETILDALNKLNKQKTFNDLTINYDELQQVVTEFEAYLNTVVEQIITNINKIYK